MVRPDRGVLVERVKYIFVELNHVGYVLLDIDLVFLI